jgi:hypothetical protein
MRTLKRKLGISTDAKSRGHVMAALYNQRTESRARDLVAKVIKATTSPKKAKYIHNN